MVAELEPLIDKVWRHCESTGQSRTDRDAEGQVCRLRDHHAKPIRLLRLIASRDDLARLSIGLLENATPLPKAVRLLGVSLSSLQGEDDTEPQLDFSDLNRTRLVARAARCTSDVVRRIATTNA